MNIDDVTPRTWIDVGRWMQMSTLSDALVRMSILGRETMPDNPGVQVFCDGLIAASARLETNRERLEASLDETWPEWRAAIGPLNLSEENDGD